MPKKVAKKAVTKTAPAKPVKKSNNAGRPKGSGKFGCETKAVRIPVHLEGEVQEFVKKQLKKTK